MARAALELTGRRIQMMQERLEAVSPARTPAQRARYESILSVMQDIYTLREERLEDLLLRAWKTMAMVKDDA